MWTVEGEDDFWYMLQFAVVPLVAPSSTADPSPRQNITPNSTDHDAGTEICTRPQSTGTQPVGVPEVKTFIGTTRGCVET
jgi:hypothetical protein